jgi:hypothetical protein
VRATPLVVAPPSTAEPRQSNAARPPHDPPPPRPPAPQPGITIVELPTRATGAATADSPRATPGSLTPTERAPRPLAVADPRASASRTLPLLRQTISVRIGTVEIVRPAPARVPAPVPPNLVALRPAPTNPFDGLDAQRSWQARGSS